MATQSKWVLRILEKEGNTPPAAVKHAREMLRFLFDAVPNMTQPLISAFPEYVNIAWAHQVNGVDNFFMLDVTGDAVRPSSDDIVPAVDYKAPAFVDRMRALHFQSFAVNDCLFK